ncbi:DNA-dependent RNA polymerase subunit epsilon [Pradoshia sp.]
MIFKVFFQENAAEVPVREKTKTAYVEGISERDVRQKLKSLPYNVEFVQVLDAEYLEFEKQNPDFRIMEIE